MKILGVSAHYHDAAAALLIDGLPVAAVQEERRSRRKNDSAFPIAAIEYCLDEAGLEPEALDAIIFYERPMLKFDRVLTTLLRAFPHSRRAFAHGMKNMLGEKLWVRGIIRSELGASGAKILFAEHHQSHAAAAFLTAPTQAAAILTADGVGEWATLTTGRGKRGADGTRIELDREIRFPNSLGMLYSTFTAYLGFAVNEGEYKVMGLAAYGRPEMADKVRQLVPRTADGAFRLDMDYFDFDGSARRSFSDAFVRLFGPPRKRFEPIEPDLARETYLDALSAAAFAGRLASPGGHVLEVARAAVVAPPPVSTPRAPDRLLDGLALNYAEGYPAGVPDLKAALETFGDNMSVDEELRWMWLINLAALHLGMTDIGTRSRRGISS